MDKEIKVWLYDIESAINEIDSFFEEGQKYLRTIKKTSKQNVL